LTYNMAENSWHRYDMKKLRHCHPMYSPAPQSDRGRPTVDKAVVPCQNKIILKNFSVARNHA